jgi:hypothetical protein
MDVQRIANVLLYWIVGNALVSTDAARRSDIHRRC